MKRPLYNELAGYYDIIEGRDWKRETDRLAFFLKKHGAKSVADLGCGTGYHVRALTKLGFEATGIDISRQNVLFARQKSKDEHVRSKFVIGSYYDYRPPIRFDSALCMNWSIPVKDTDIRRFLDNTNSLLRSGGLLIFDFELGSKIDWRDVGKPIIESWIVGDKWIVRVSVGQITSNILSSRDVYLIYPKLPQQLPPSEWSRYHVSREDKNVRVYIDRSYVRFFSLSEIRTLARRSLFRIVNSYSLPRKKYQRSYVVLEKVN